MLNAMVTVSQLAPGFMLYYEVSGVCILSIRSESS